jgi:cytochrome b involved in lipid metabolism
LLKGAGQDLTDAFEAAGHSELARVFTRNFRIGTVAMMKAKVAANGSAVASR